VIRRRRPVDKTVFFRASERCAPLVVLRAATWLNHENITRALPLTLWFTAPFTRAQSYKKIYIYILLSLLLLLQILTRILTWIMPCVINVVETVLHPITWGGESSAIIRHLTEICINAYASWFWASVSNEYRRRIIRLVICLFKNILRVVKYPIYQKKRIVSGNRNSTKLVHTYIYWLTVKTLYFQLSIVWWAVTGRIVLKGGKWWCHIPSHGFFNLSVYLKF